MNPIRARTYPRSFSKRNVLWQTAVVNQFEGSVLAEKPEGIRLCCRGTDPSVRHAKYLPTGWTAG